jgi:hypothetical protein
MFMIFEKVSSMFRFFLVMILSAYLDNSRELLLDNRRVDQRVVAEDKSDDALELADGN